MVKDLVAGSGLTFAAAGAYELKGSPTHGSYIPPSIDEREARSGQTLEANLICGRNAAKTLLLSDLMAVARRRSR
jgi:hypothetical protein